MFQVSFIGNVGRDPEQRQSQSGADYTSFSVAVRTRDPEVPEWWQVQIWGKLGEWALNNVQKGSSVWIGGQGDLNRWENRDGEAQVNLSCRATICRFAGPKPSDVPNRGRRNNNRSQGQRNSRPANDEPPPF